MTGKDGADALDFQIRAIGLPTPEREYRAVPPRLFRLDLAWPDRRLFVEVDGYGVGGHMGRHATHAGMRSDCEKSALLAIAGWRGMRVTTDHVKNGQALKWIEEALQSVRTFGVV